MRALVLSIVLAAPGLAAAQFKCTGPDGATTYQQAPCPARARAEALRLPPAAPPDAPIIAIGMTRAEVDASPLGPPTFARRSVSGGHVRHQLVYRLGRRTAYVYLTDGIVTALSESE